MESLLLKMLPSVLEQMNDVKKKEDILLTLKKFYLIECRFNLKVLATFKWKNVSDGFKKEMIKSLKTDSGTALFGFADKSKIKYLLELTKIKTNSKIHNEVKIVSMISKIEVLKTLSSLNEKFQNDNKVIYNMRLNNLEKQIKEIVEQLEQDIK